MIPESVAVAVLAGRNQAFDVTLLMCSLEPAGNNDTTIKKTPNARGNHAALSRVKRKAPIYAPSAVPGSAHLRTLQSTSLRYNQQRCTAETEPATLTTGGIRESGNTKLAIGIKSSAAPPAVTVLIAQARQVANIRAIIGRGLKVGGERAGGNSEIL